MIIVASSVCILRQRIAESNLDGHNEPQPVFVAFNSFLARISGISVYFWLSKPVKEHNVVNPIDIIDVHGL